MAGVLSGMGMLPQQGTCHLIEEGIEATFAWIDRIDSAGYHVMLFTRLPPRRLLGKVDLNSVESLWLTERDAANALNPSLERIASRIRDKIAEKSGIIVLDGLEHLMSQHGFAAVLTFLRAMIDDLSTTSWSLLIPVEPLAFETTEIARLRREAPVWAIPQSGEKDTDNLAQEEDSVKDEIVQTESESDLPTYDTSDDGSIKLVHLTKLPRAGFNSSILRRRILAWRRMSLDVSELEPAMKYQDIDRAYALYRVVEEKVRTAVELDRRIDLLEAIGDSANATSFRFRTRQLTGLEEIWRSLDILLKDQSK